MKALLEFKFITHEPSIKKESGGEMTNQEIINKYQLTPIDYVKYCQFSIFENIREKTTNWPLIDFSDEEKLIEVIPIPVRQHNEQWVLDEKQQNDEYLFVLKISRSFYRPHQNVNNHLYYIRRDKDESKKDGKSKKSSDGCSGTMDFKEVMKETTELEYRLKNSNCNPIYLVYGYHAQKLFKLIDSGDIGKIEKRLNKMPGLLTAQNSFGQNILDWAALRGKDEICHMLIKNYKLSPYRSDNEGITPLLRAVYAGKLSTVKFLIKEYFCPFEQKSRAGNNPILIAALYGHIEILKYFIDILKQPMDIKNYSGRNPLFVAVHGNEFDMIKFIFSRAPQLLTGTDRLNENILQVAERYNCSQEIKSFLTEKLKDIEHQKSSIVKAEASSSFSQQHVDRFAIPAYSANTQKFRCSKVGPECNAESANKKKEESKEEIMCENDAQKSSVQEVRRRTI